MFKQVITNITIVNPGTKTLNVRFTRLLLSPVDAIMFIIKLFMFVDISIKHSAFHILYIYKSLQTWERHSISLLVKDFNSIPLFNSQNIINGLISLSSTLQLVKDLHILSSVRKSCDFSSIVERNWLQKYGTSTLPVSFLNLI